MSTLQSTDARLWKYAEAGDVEGVHRMIDDDCNVNWANDWGKNSASPLMAAASGGHVKVIALLLKHNADVKMTDEYKSTALHYAAQHGQAEAAQLLINSGPSIDRRNREGCTPLHVAAREGNLEVAAMLLQNGARVNIAGEWNATPLDFAIRDKRVEMIKLLAQWGANPTSKIGYRPCPIKFAKDNRDTAHLVSILKEFTSHKKAVDSGKQETVQGFLRQSIADKDVKQMKKSYRKINNHTSRFQGSVWQTKLRRVLDDHKLEMVYYAFKIDEVETIEAIFNWINGEQWIRTATFSDGSTLLQRALSHRKVFAVTSMLSHGLDPYEGSKASQPLPLLCHSTLRVSADKLIASYRTLQKAINGLPEDGKNAFTQHILDDFKVEMLYAAFETSDEEKRDAIISWIDDKDWIQTAKYSDESTLMQRAVRSQNWTALRKMVRYRIDPYKLITENRLIPKGKEEEEKNDETPQKIIEAMTLEYEVCAMKLLESHDMPPTDRGELMNSMRFFSTCVSNVCSIITFAVVNLQEEGRDAFIEKCLELPMLRRFVYDRSERDEYVNYLAGLRAQAVITKERREHFRMDATNVNAENTVWVHEIKASVQKNTEHREHTKHGLKKLREEFDKLKVSLRNWQEQQAEHDKIQNIISAICGCMIFFGAPSVGRLVQAIINMMSPKLVLDAITERSGSHENKLVLKQEVRCMIESSGIPPQEFVAKLKEAADRVSDKDEEPSVAQAAGGAHTRRQSANAYSRDEEENDPPNAMN